MSGFISITITESSPAQSYPAPKSHTVSGTLPDLDVNIKGFSRAELAMVMQALCEIAAMHALLLLGVKPEEVVEQVAVAVRGTYDAAKRTAAVDGAIGSAPR